MITPDAEHGGRPQGRVPFGGGDRVVARAKHHHRAKGADEKIKLARTSSAVFVAGRIGTDPLGRLGEPVDSSQSLVSSGGSISSRPPGCPAE
jgi:hypothetical protein